MRDAAKEPRGFGSGLRLLYEVMFRRDQWNIGVIDAPIHTLLVPNARPAIQWLPAPAKATFVADPFGVEVDGAYYLFFEFFDYREYRGRLFGAKLDKAGSISGEIEILPSSVHLSYPYVFQHQGAVYCIPEMWQARRVTLYRADELPGKWTEVAVLLDGIAAVDTTVFMHEGRWWLFCTDRDRDWQAELFAWYSDSLSGPWMSHERCPVKQDIGSSRPAGTPFVHEGNLYRPAQDCSTSYGGRVVINRIEVLTPDEFHEEPVAYVEPDKNGPYPDGTHTLSTLGDITLIDGNRAGFSWWGLVGTCRKALRRLRGKSGERA